MRTILQTGATALGISVFFTGMAFAASPQEDLVRGWLEGSSFGLEVTIGESGFNAARQSVELENVRIGRQGDAVVITFARMSVDDPRRTPDGMFAANSVRGSGMKANIHIDPGRWFPGIAKLAEQDLADQDDDTDEDDTDQDGESDADVKVDVTRPFDVTMEADGLVFERVVLPMRAPDIAPDATVIDAYLTVANWSVSHRMDWYELRTVTIATVGQGTGDTTTTYDVMFASGIHDGRIERFGAENMLQVAEIDGTRMEIGARAFEGLGIDLNALLEVLDPAAYQDGVGDGRWRTAALEIGYEDLTVSSEGIEFSVAGARMHGVRVRQTPKPILPLYAELLLDPARIEQDPMQFFREVMPNAAGLYGVDSFQVSDLQVHAPDDISFRLGRFDLAGFDSNGIGAMTFRDIFVGAAGAGSGELKLLTLNNLRFGSLLAWLDMGEAIDPETGEPTPAAMRDAVLLGMPALDFLELSGLSIDLPDGSIGLDAYTNTSSDYLHQLARRYDASITRFSMPASLITDPTTRQTLASLGYDRIAVSAGISAHYDTDTGDFRLLDLTVSGLDVGMITADLHLGNIPLSIIDDPETIEERLRDATLVEGSATFGNHSIVERVFEMQAKQMNQSAEQFRKDFAAGMPFMLGMLGDREVQKRFADALKTFFDDPQSIRVSLKPVAPLPIRMFDEMESDPAALLQLLNVGVEANR